MVKILLEPNAPLKQYKKLFALEGISLEFTDDAVATIGLKRAKLNTGARGLRTILESLMLDMQYELPEQAADIMKLTVTKEVVEGTAKPIQTQREDKGYLIINDISGCSSKRYDEYFQRYSRSLYQATSLDSCC